MKTIELRKGLSVRKTSIDGIEEISEFETLVYVRLEKHITKIPYNILLEMLEFKEDETSLNNNNIMKKLDGYLSQVGVQVP